MHRSIGRWSLTALVLNSIIGSSIFGVPSIVAGLIGANSVYAYFIAAVAMGLIVACFAEVGSRFHASGGPYLYTRTAFGGFVGIEVFWLSWLVRLTAAAANANLFVSYLSQIWPQAESHWYRVGIITIMVGGLAWVNYLGVSPAVLVSNTFAVFKLLIFVGFIAAGLAYLHNAGVHPVSTGSKGDWLDAILVLLFAYGGFEAALLPGGELRNPNRDVPFSLFSGLLIAAVLYSLIQYVVIRVLANAAATDHPLSVAARQVLGPVGSGVMTCAALLCAYGYLSGQMLSVPRLTYALAEKGDFPKFFAAVHRTHTTPYVSIVVYAVFVLLLALTGGYRWNVTLSVISRLVMYGSVCIALPVLRRKQPATTAFRMPAGIIVSALASVVCIMLLSRAKPAEILVLLATTSIGFLNWKWVASSQSKRSKPGYFDAQ